MKTTCDICGAAATNWTRDIAVVGERGGFIQYEPGEETHAGCDDHPATVRTVYRPHRVMMGDVKAVAEYFEHQV